jgi:hypothetical protein
MGIFDEYGLSIESWERMEEFEVKVFRSFLCKRQIQWK